MGQEPSVLVVGSKPPRDAGGANGVSGACAQHHVIGRHPGPANIGIRILFFFSMVKSKIFLI